MRSSGSGFSPIRATAWSDGEDVNYPFSRPAVEDHAPLADSQPPEALRTTKALDVAIGQLADGRANSVAFLPSQLAEGLQRGGADLDPPSA
jgi:hypothetical protein